jgi:hypothetical protein
VDHLGVAARIYLEHLRIQANRRGEALCLLETLRRIISGRQKCERRNGYVVGQAIAPSLAGRGGPYGSDGGAKGVPSSLGDPAKPANHRQSSPPKMLGEHLTLRPSGYL